MSEVEEFGPDKRPKTGGRQRGTPNVVTRDVRQAMAMLTEGTLLNLQRWLDQVARDDPAKAIELFIRLLEFSIPKLHTAVVDIREPAVRTVQHLSIAELEAMLAS